MRWSMRAFGEAVTTHTTVYRLVRIHIVASCQAAAFMPGIIAVSTIVIAHNSVGAYYDK